MIGFIIEWAATAFVFLYSFFVTVLYVMYLGKYHDWRCKAEMLSRHVDILKIRIKQMEKRSNG